MDGMRGLDAWITSGRYSKAQGWVTCRKCGEETCVISETEYGTSWWSPEECPKCGTTFEGDEPWQDDEPDPDRAYDQMIEDRMEGRE